MKIRTVHCTYAFMPCKDCGGIGYHRIEYLPRCKRCHEAWKKVETDPLNRQGKVTSPQNSS